MTYRLTKETGEGILTEDGGRIFTTTINDEVQVYQDSWIISNPIYFQTPTTHLTTPTAGTEVAPNNLSAEIPGKPGSSWNASGIDPGAMDYSVEMHEYVTPSGAKGYQIIHRRILAGTPQRQSWGYGPEATARTTGGWI